MYNYRIYLKEKKEPIHEKTTLDLPIKITIGETLTYSGKYKVIDIVHHISEKEVFTDLYVEKID